MDPGGLLEQPRLPALDASAAALEHLEAKIRSRCELVWRGAFEGRARDSPPSSRKTARACSPSKRRTARSARRRADAVASSPARPNPVSNGPSDPKRRHDSPPKTAGWRRRCEVAVCAFGRDALSDHLLKATLAAAGEPVDPAPLSGSQSNCALASETLRFGKKPLEQGVRAALQALIARTRRPVRLEVELPKHEGPDRITLAEAEITLGCHPQKDTGCKRHESPPQRVVVKAFQRDRTEVTVRAYRQCVERKQCDPPLCSTRAATGLEKTRRLTR